MITTRNMRPNVIERPFNKMGARVKVDSFAPNRWRRDTTPTVSLNVRRDEKGEYFQITKDPEVDLQVLHLDVKDRHLLLMARRPSERLHQPPVSSKFLLGHDERHWFVAGISRASVSTVAQAKDSLKPVVVKEAEKGLSRKHLNRRKNAARVRQGEWFFIPVDVKVDARQIHKNEPIRRGRSKPHMCAELYREGGESVWVNRENPNGISGAEYQRLPESQRGPGWRNMVRNARVLVRGRITHPDHETLVLNGWHEVHMNSEAGSAEVAFLD